MTKSYPKNWTRLDIQKAFSALPKDQILSVANKIKDQIKSNPLLIKTKHNKDFVTMADLKIQQIILKYLSHSSLKDCYKIKAEEKLSTKEKAKNSDNKAWQLIVDPLDGTGSFCRDEPTWGVMIGVCDRNGYLKYSWNLVSSGEIFSSSSKSVPPISWLKKIKQTGKIRIDIYDYNAGASERFAAIFEKISGWKNQQYEIISYPAAVWVGWKLFKDELDGLLWLPSEKGKKNYPDYDLIFLGALEKKGYKIRLGKIDENIEMIAIAPTEYDLDLLFQIGLKMLPKDRKNFLIPCNELKIT
ncbi:hypothetical protein HYV56_01940 [Candidatus Peregrinibacteria bacterium]|nr:hypothetical protein [Candidatus Peregrinibacteria bacterium]